MSNALSAVSQFGRLDDLARRDSVIHRIDPRAKVLTTLAYVVCVVSFGRYEITALLSFVLYPAALAAAAHLPVGWLLKRLLWVSPFAVLVGIFNPLLDRTPLLVLNGFEISGGWVSFVSILLRFALTVSAVLILIASTGFESVCRALQRLGVPTVFTVQLLFLYRYIFVLIEETVRLVRARALRNSSGRRPDLRQFGVLAGQLLLRTIDRAERISRAMNCRGFTGQIHLLNRLQFQTKDAVFIGGWILLLAVFRIVNIPQVVGSLLT